MSAMPWLGARKKTVTLMDANSDGKITGESDAMDEGAMACAEDLLSAIAMKDTKATAKALQAAFDYFDSEPYVDGNDVD